MTEHYEVRVTEHAEEAMHEIARYIAFELLDPQAALSYRSNSNLWEYKEKDRIRGPFLSVAERRFEPRRKPAKVHSYWFFF